MLWSPGTRIFTCVVALAKRSSRGWCPVPPVAEGVVKRRPGVPRILPPASEGGSRSGRHRGPRPGSPGRPGHRPAPEQVEVQVIDALAGVPADVRDESPPARVDALGPREMRRGLEQVGEHPAVAILELAQRPSRAPSGSAAGGSAPAGSASRNASTVSLECTMSAGSSPATIRQNTQLELTRCPIPAGEGSHFVEAFLPAGSPRARASSSRSRRCSFVRSRGVSTEIVRNRSPLPRRPRFGIPLPRRRSVVPGATPGSSPTRSGPSSVSTSISAPSAACTIGTSSTANTSWPWRSNTSSSWTRTER